MSTRQTVALGKVSARILRNTNKGCTLNVVIEGTVLLPVFSQKPKSIVVSKVFKLDQCVLAIPTEHGKRCHHWTETETKSKSCT